MVDPLLRFSHAPSVELMPGDLPNTLLKLWTYYEVREKSLGNPVMAYECFPHVYEDEGEPEDISLASLPANLNVKFGAEL